MSVKQLFILRHADSLPYHMDGDKERSLSPQGVDDAMGIGRIMLDSGYSPDIILCSPAQRTRQTLTCLEKEWAQKNLDCYSTVFPEILYNGSVSDYLYEIQQVSDEHDNILLVAHNPSIYELVLLLAAQGRDDMIQKLSMGYNPATLSVINCKCDKWSDIKPVENELSNLIAPMDYN